MSNTGKPAKAPSPEKPRGSGYPIERNPVEARQGFRDKPVLYVLIASLALIMRLYRHRNQFGCADSATQLLSLKASMLA